MSGLTIELAGLRSGASRVWLEADPADLELDTSDWPRPIGADLQVEKSGERFTIRGELRAFAALECVRCLKHFELPVTAPLDVFAERSGTGSRHEQDELERDRYMKFHDGRQIDLREEAHDALLLEIPLAPRCREDCRGLCLRCGADLNEGPCACSVET
jgi:uncharacterized protein